MTPAPGGDAGRRLGALLDRPVLARVLSVLDGDGEETRIVGGAVRNTLLGLPVTDVDLATTAIPAVTTARARAAGFRAVPTGIAHGTVTVMADETPFEVTTLREDVETDGRHAVVAFGRDFRADAERRDFTINALSLGRGGHLHDTVGGWADLAVRRVRFIGNPDRRIREDYLRILRFFRFHAQYGLAAPDRDGLLACIRGRNGLAQLSAERVRTEMLKLLAAPGAVAATATLSEAGLLARLTGGVGDAGRLARTPPDPVRRLAALLVTTIEDAERLRARLRLSNADHDRLAAHARLVARLRSVPALDRAETRRLAFAFGPGILVETVETLAGEPRPRVAADGRAQLDAFAAGERAPVLPLTGRDLILQGVPPGRELGRRLAVAQREWLAAGCP